METLHRKAQQKPWKEHEIISLLLGIASALLECEERGLKPAHLSKESICLGRNGEWMLLLRDDVTEPHPSLLYRGALNPDLFKKNYGLSPEILQAISGQPHPI